MAEHKAKSNDYVLLMGNGATPEVFSPVVCMTSVGFNRSRQIIESNSKCGNSKTPGTKSYNVPIEGQIVFDPDAPKLSIKALNDAFESDSQKSYKLGPVTPVTGDLTYAFKGFFSSLNDTYPTDADSTFSGQLEVDPATLVITETE